MKTPQNQWSKLDNAAKIFPSTAGKSDTRVFRFVCELYEAIDKDILTLALDKTLKIFPFYLSVMRRGLFWYYFEPSQLEPVVEQENAPVCGPLFDTDCRRLLFSVTYYRNRINLEVFHALSDGTGALDFLRTLVHHYLLLSHKDAFPPELASPEYGSSVFQKMDDSFQKYYNANSRSLKEKYTPAYHLRGSRFPEYRMGVIEGILPTPPLLALAKKYNSTLTVFLTALMISSIHNSMTFLDERKPITITVPVNLRNYFHSESARNFFSIINVSYKFKSSSDTLEEIIAQVKATFEKELTKDRLGRRMNSMMALERNIFAKIVPLTLKDISLRIANNTAQRQVTAALSNLGRIKMPEEFRSYIRLFDVFTSSNRLQVCMCSYAENTVISFTSPLQNCEVQRSFFCTLSELGAEAEIVTNRIYNE